MKTLPLSTIIVLVISTMATTNVYAQTNSSGPEPQPVKDWLANHPNFTGCVHTDLKTGESREITCIHPELSPMGMYEPQNNKHVMSPLKQFKSGIAPKDVTCWKGLQLIFKAEDQTPICVKPDNVKKLVSRGWAILYYHDLAAKPKITLYDYSYDGIDKDNGTVSINNQTYYQTTLSYSAYNLPKRTSISFQNVTFAFPQGSLITPGGGFLMLDMKFPDGSEEIYGGKTLVQNGSATEISGIQIPTQYGPHLAAKSVTVLSNHMMPQAGITIYHDKIRLLVSK